MKGRPERRSRRVCTCDHVDHQPADNLSVIDLFGSGLLRLDESVQEIRLLRVMIIRVISLVAID